MNEKSVNSEDLANLTKDELQEEVKFLRNSLHGQSILFSVITLANEAEDKITLFNWVLQSTLVLMEFDAGGVYLRTAPTSAKVITSINLPEDFLSEVGEITLDSPLYTKLFENAEPLFTDEYHKISPKHSERWGFASVASVPIRSNKRILGALNIVSKKRHFITEHEREILLTIGTVVGTALERITHKEESLIQRDNLFKFFNSSQDMFFILGEKGEIIYANNYALSRLEFTLEEIKGTNVINLHVENRRDEALKIVGEMLAGTSEFCPVPLQSKTGAIIPVETRITLGEWEGKPSIFGITRDITYKLEAEEKLKKQEQRLRDITNDLGEGLIVVDKTDKVIFMNSKAEQLLGWTAKDLNKFNAHETIHSNKLNSKGILHEHCFIRMCMKQGGIVRSENDEFITKAGKKFPISAIASPYVENGQIIGSVVSFQDITELVLLEEQYKKVNEDLVVSNQNKDRFFSIISHDLRGPFQHLLGLSELIKTNPQQLGYEKVAYYGGKLYDSLQNQFNLLNQLLEWSRIQSGRFQPEYTIINLYTMVQEVVRLIENSITQKNIVLIVEIPKTVTVSGDYNMIFTAIRNIVSNALKFTPRFGFINIHAWETKEGMVQFSVADTGVGMEPEIVQKLFKIQHQVSSKGTEGEKGSGLGLILVSEIIEKHGGTMKVTSRLGAGTTVSFLIPQYQQRV